MTALSKLHLSGWKSIKDATIELGPLSVLIGANGSGKSNLLSFFHFLSSLVEGRMDVFVAKEGGANAILHFGVKTTGRLSANLTMGTEHESITFETYLEHGQPDTLVVNPYPPDLATPVNGETITNFSLAGKIIGWIRERPGLGGEAMLNAFLKQIRLAHFHDTSPAALGRLTGYIHNNQFLQADAGNLAVMLYLYKQTAPTVYRRIVSTVRKIVPNFDDFTLAAEDLNPNSILLRWRQLGHDYLFGPHQLSDGSLRAIALTALLLQPEKDLPSLLFLDEPEIGLHPYALELIAGLIRAASVRTQVIVATQSAAFVDLFEPEEIIVTEAPQGETLFRRLAAEPLRDWLEDYSVGQLWERNVIGGGPMP